MFPPIVALLRRATAPIWDAAFLTNGWTSSLSAISLLVERAPISVQPSSCLFMPFSSGRFVMMTTGREKDGLTPVPLAPLTIKSEPPARAIASFSSMIARASSRFSGIYIISSIVPLLSLLRVQWNLRSSHNLYICRYCR